MSQNKKLVIKLSLVVLGALMQLNLNGQNMEKYKWQNRILIIKSPTKQDLKYLAQTKEYNNSNIEFKERKLLVYEIVGDKYRLTDYQKSKEKSQWQDLLEKNETVLDSLSEFEVILIGLDGGVKLKKRDVLIKEDLFKTIDRMPMRLRELREEKNKNRKEK